MALVYRDCVKQTTTATDDNDLSLESTAFQGYRTFDDALSDGDTCYYLLDEKVSGQWEIGLGTFTAPSLLERTTVYQSSNSNNKIDLFNGSYPEVSIVTRAATFQTIENTINAATAGTSLVAEYEVTGSAATEITISSLDLAADIGWDIEISVIGGVASLSYNKLHVNGNTTAGNYATRYLYNDTTSTLYTAGITDAYIDGGTETTSDIIHTNIKMSLAGGYPVWNSNSFATRAFDTAILRFDKFATAGNVTSISLTAGAASAIGIGSKIKIYRWLV